MMLEIYLKNKEILKLKVIKVDQGPEFIRIITKNKAYSINLNEIIYMTESIKKRTAKQKNKEMNELISKVVNDKTEYKPECFCDNPPRIPNAAHSEPRKMDKGQNGILEKIWDLGKG